MPRRFAVLVALTLLLVASPRAWATQVIPRSPQEMGTSSALVVRGTVADVRSFWSPGRTKIFTEVTVDVAEDFKGDAPPTVRILQLGGVVDGVRVTVSGALQWRDGEEVLLFLEPYVADAYQVAGFSQGRYEIERDPRTGEALVSRRALKGLEMIGDRPRDAAAPVQRMPLQRLLDAALGAREGR